MTKQELGNEEILDLTAEKADSLRNMEKTQPERTTFKQEGFLSDTIVETIADFNARYEPWITLYHQLNRHACNAIVESEKPRKDTVAKIFAVNLFFRILTCFQSTLLILERGNDIDVKALLRVMMEALFSLEAIQKVPAFAEEIILSDEAGRYKRLVAALEAIDAGGAEEFRTPEQVKELRAEVAKLTAERADPKYVKLREYSVKDIATQAEMEGRYKHDYKHLCAFTHGSPQGLRDYLDTEKKPGFTMFKFGPEDKEAEANMAIAQELLILALHALEVMLNLPIRAESAKLEKRFIEVNEWAKNVQSKLGLPR